MRVLKGLAALVVVAGGGWWLVFGTFSPCEALASEARRIGSREAGFLGRFAAGFATDFKAGDFSPIQCAEEAVKLKLGGARALEALLLREEANPEGQ